LILESGNRQIYERATALSRGRAGAGIGYVWRDGEAEPTRIRLAWVSDDDIREAVERYAPPQDGPTLTVVPG
jgi:hypothetical protein